MIKQGSKGITSARNDNNNSRTKTQQDMKQHDEPQKQAC